MTVSTTSPEAAPAAYALAQKIDMALHDAIGMMDLDSPVQKVLSAMHSDVHDLAFALKNPEAAPAAEVRETPWTLGPWTATRTKTPGCGAIEWWIAACPAPNMEKDICCLYGDREASNARLIAAAPGLFTALKGMMALFDAEDGINPIRDYERAALVQARAALARATQQGAGDVE